MIKDTKLPADLDALAEQLAALRAEMASLTQSVAATAERRGRKMAADLSDGMDEAVKYVETRGKSAEVALETSIATHPFLALGLAVGAGLMLGALTRR